jgi:hypothetical protein
MASGHVLRRFRNYKRRLRKGSNVRRRILTPAEFLRLIHVAPSHLASV